MGTEQKKGGKKRDIIPTQCHEMAEEGWLVSWEARAPATLALLPYPLSPASLCTWGNVGVGRMWRNGLSLVRGKNDGEGRKMKRETLTAQI